MGANEKLQERDMAATTDQTTRNEEPSERDVDK